MKRNPALMFTQPMFAQPGIRVMLCVLTALASHTLNAQSVGIGETAPQAKLHVRSNSILYGNSSLLINNLSNDVLMNVRDNGYTGIGTANPEARLHIRSDFEAFRVQGNSSYLSFYDDLGAYKGYLWNHTGNGIELGTASGTGLPVIIAPNNVPDVNFLPGLTGFGNSNPAFRLDITGRMRIRAANSSETPGIWFNNPINTASPAFVGMNSANLFGFYGIVGGWSFLFDCNNGNVGVGAIPDFASLTVRKNGIAVDAGSTTPNGTAVLISQGSVRVAGAGSGTNTVAFVHRATGANSTATGYTVIDNIHCNNDPTAILQVTMNGTYGPGVFPGNESFPEVAGSGGSCQIISATSFIIFYNGPNSGIYDTSPAFARDRWCIKTYSGCSVVHPANFNFNVFVIKTL